MAIDSILKDISPYEYPKNFTLRHMRKQNTKEAAAKRNGVCRGFGPVIAFVS